MGKRYSHKIVIIILVTLFGCHRDISFFPTTSYYREKDFIQTINKKNPDNIKIELTDENIFPVSGTVSHHLLVGSITNQWFKELKKLRDIKTFIILTPNHYNQGKEIISLSKNNDNFFCILFAPSLPASSLLRQIHIFFTLLPIK